jgi:hypothetical protein
MVQLDLYWSDGHVSFTTLHRRDASFAMIPRAASNAAGTAPGFSGPNLETVHPVVLRLNPPNRPWVVYTIRIPRNSTCVTAVLDRLSTKSSRASARLARLPSWLSQHGHSSMYICACRCPQVSATVASHPVSWSLGPSLTSVLHRSGSINTARHVPTWPLPHHRPSSPSSTHAHHKPRDMLHNPTHAMVSSQTQPKTQITFTITHHKSEPQGHISTLCLQKQLQISRFNYKVIDPIQI